MSRPQTLDSVLDRCIVGDSGCWLWQGFLNQYGYGRAKWRGRNWLVHRLVYELMERPIPAGLTIDHLCRVRNCLNPGHMEPVTSRENTLRGDTVPARHLAKTHCSRGHEFNEENTYRFGPERRWRQCRPCQLINQEERKSRSGA